MDYSNNKIFDELYEEASKGKNKFSSDGGVSKRIDKGYTRYTAQMTMANGRKIQVNKSTKAEAEAALEELREMKSNGYSIVQGMSWKDKLAKYPKVYSRSIYSKSDPGVVEGLRKLVVHETLEAYCLEGSRNGRHKASECTRWYRFRENAKNWRVRDGWDFWLDIRCFDGIVHAYRYDRDLVFNENYTVTGLPSVYIRRVRGDDGNLVPRKLGNAKFGIRKNKRGVINMHDIGKLDETLDQLEDFLRELLKHMKPEHIEEEVSKLIRRVLQD